MTNIYSTPVNEEPIREPQKKKPIEIVRYIDPSKLRHLDKVAQITILNAASWDNLRLVIKGKNDEFDVIAAWDNFDSCGISLYLGYWNDGIIE